MEPTYYVRENGLDKPYSITDSNGAHEFVEKYSKFYYSGANESENGFKTHKNSEKLENMIIEILQNGIKEKEAIKDIFWILAWKMGKVTESDNGSLVPAKGWVEANGEGKFYNTKLDIKSFAKKVACLADEYMIGKTDPQTVLKKLKKMGIKGLGTVYLITFLYFISRGEWYIYDQYAMRALCALHEGLELGSRVVYFDPPEKSSNDFEALEEKLIRPYKEAILDIFRDELSGEEGTLDYIKAFRKVDQALWVYGHAFHKPVWNHFWK